MKVDTRVTAAYHGNNKSISPRWGEVAGGTERVSGTRPTCSSARLKETTMAKVAFVGLGVMGFPMAGHLKAKGGHEVTVYNRTAAKAEKWVAQYGGKSAPTPRQAADGQDFVLACVGNDNDLREVMLGKDGVFAGVRKGAVL